MIVAIDLCCMARSGYRILQIPHKPLHQIHGSGVEGHPLGPEHERVQPILLFLRERRFHRGQGSMKREEALRRKKYSARVL